ncbi:MAG: prepilin peptidase [Candidatus Omnitrophota bacterium]|jgi:leader peptidase (prepilin peptidase)/N-methyltransferase
MPEIINKIFVFVFGTIVGSFLNVCIHRMPKDMSIVKPRSFCPHCKTPIHSYDNIPLVSYLILGGRCRKCKEKISFRYPLVELITGIFFLVLYFHLGFSLSLTKYLFFFSLLIVVSFIDIDYHAIPAYLCFIGILVGLALDFVITINLLKSGSLNDPTQMPIYISLKALIFGLGFTYLFKFFGDIFINMYLAFRKKESIEGEKESLGLGDVDFMGLVGVYLGMKAVIVVFFLAPFFALAYSFVGMFFKKSHLIPYLPYLSLAAMVFFFWGNQILKLVGFVF